MVVNLACLLPQAPLISKELMFYFEGQTTTLFFFLFAYCILLLLFFFVLFFENFIHKDNGGALHKKKKRKKKTYPVHKAPAYAGSGRASWQIVLFLERLIQGMVVPYILLKKNR